MNNFSFYKDGKALYCLIFAAAFLSFSSLQASSYKRNRFFSIEQHQIQGTISDGTDPLPGVTIAVKNKLNSSTISDYSGQYTISASPNDTLVVSFIGFKTALVPIKGRAKVDVQLLFDTTTLQEVRINAGYYTVKEKERTGSIARITSKDIEKQPANNPLAAMQGRMSGVNITQTSGAPGGSFTIQIRGINSIRAEGNDPLYVIDGVPYASQSLGNSDLSIGILPNNISPLNNINPGDIENIEVLKDADATAIYGSRGANGVVLITTKKGKQGETRFSVQGYTSLGKVTNTMDLMNTQQYLTMRAEAFANDGITQYTESAYDINGTWDTNQYTDWQKKLIGGTAIINNIQASISGGSAKTQYLLSGTYRKESTVYPGDSQFKKGVVHTSLSHRSENDKFKLVFSADYASDNNTLPGFDLTAQSYALAPNAPALYDNQGNLNWENGTFDNPLAFLEGKYIAKTKSLISNAMLSYSIVSGLELRTSLGYNDSQVSQSRTRPLTMSNPANNPSNDLIKLYLNNGSRSSWIIEPQIDWKKTVGKAEINFLIGATFQEQKQQVLAQTGIGFPSDALIYNLASAANILIENQDMSVYRYNAFFGRANITWKERYILNITGRRDGSSRFGPDKRFANFGAIGAAWIFSSESFIKNNLSFLSFGKLRASYGITGNDQIGDYQFLDTYSVSPNQYNGLIGLQPSRLFNASFAWETNRKFEAALEIGLFKDNLFFSAAYFRNRSSNQLVGVPLPGTAGFPSIQANLDATVQNTGLELELRTVNFKRNDFQWTTTLNLTVPQNKLIEFPELQGSTYANSFVIGKPLNIYKAYHFTGIDPITGIYTFKDFNNDGNITAIEDRQSVLDTSPKIYGGLGNQLTYKNWALDFLFQFVKQDAFNYKYTTNMAGTFSNQPIEALNHFPQNGTSASTQQYTTGLNSEALDAYFNYTSSDAVVSDGSYIRLKSLSLTYTIPTIWTKTFTGKLYLQGQNLLTFTHYKGADPENQSTTFLPPLKQFTLGFQLNF